jgi:hypothetical protein
MERQTASDPIIGHLEAVRWADQFARQFWLCRAGGRREILAFATLMRSESSLFPTLGVSKGSVNNS